MTLNPLSVESISAVLTAMPLESALFEIEVGPLPRRALEVMSFRGREAISETYSFEVIVETPLPHAVIEAQLGQTTRLTIHDRLEPTRVIAGIVAAISPAPIATARSFAEAPRYRLEIVPRLWLLKQSSASRIFQDKTVVEVVSEILAASHVPFEWRLKRGYPRRDYCVQYEETDYAFVTRLLAEDGIFFFFTGDPSEVVVFQDNVHYPAANGVHTLPLRESASLVHGARSVARFALERRVRTSGARLRGHDFTRPTLELVEEAGREGDLTVVEHESDYLAPEITVAHTHQILDQHRRDALFGRGESDSRAIAAGHRFLLEEHFVDSDDGHYAITSVEHTGAVPEHGSSDVPVYENRFECVPASVPFRPQRPERVMRQVLETATVVGPKGEAIWTDTYGRVEVRFHWDERAKREHNSCFLRVMQPWGGAGYGAQFIPRVGAEVVVSFLGGDPDRPVVLGCLHNLLAPTPYVVPRDRTKTGIRTQTIGGEGYSEIAFEDRAGRERLTLRAQKDLEEIAENDHLVSVGVGRLRGPDGGNQVVKVARDQLVEVLRDQKQTIKHHRRVTVGANSEEIVSGDSRWHVRGDAFRVVDGSLDERIRCDRTRIVEGDAFEGVHGGLRSLIAGSQHTTVRGDHRLLADHDIGLSAGENIAANARGGVALEAIDTIRFVCGRSSIQLLPDEVVISSPKITAVASDTVSVQAKDSSLHLESSKAKLAAKDAIEIVAKTSKLCGEDATVELASGSAKLEAKKEAVMFGKGASVVLDDNASIDGTKVKLNCGSPKSGGNFQKPEPDALETSWVEIDLVDQDDKPVPGARYVVEAAGKTYHGVLDKQGHARVATRPGSAKVTFPDYDAAGLSAA